MLVTAGRVTTGSGRFGRFGGFGGRAGREWFSKQMTPATHEPGRIQVADGIPSRGAQFYRFIVRGPEGGTILLRYEAERARNIETTIELRQTETLAP